MEFDEKLINNQKKLLKKISEILLTGDKKAAAKIAEKYLEINNENKGGIVSFWLKEKKKKFSNYILKHIIIDINLPIYYDDEVNLALETLNSFDDVCSRMEEQWIKVIKRNFLNNILDERSINEIRYMNGEKVFLLFFHEIPFFF